MLWFKQFYGRFFLTATKAAGLEVNPEKTKQFIRSCLTNRVQEKITTKLQLTDHLQVYHISDI